MRRSYRSLPAVILSLCAVTSWASAATISGPTLVTGTDAIDPTGSQDIDERPGTLSESDLESRTDFLGSIQSLGVGFDAYSVNPVNIIEFTDPAVPDLRFTLSGSSVNGQAGININNSTRTTSGSDGLQFLQASGSSGSATVRLLIEFGDTSGGSFEPTKVVDAAAFVVGNLRASMSYDVAFRDSHGAPLASQSQTTSTVEGTAGSGDGIEAFFSYAGDGTTDKAVSSILITRTGGGNIGSAIDDLGFTTALALPEPTTLGLFGAAAGMVGMRRRRAN